VLTWATSIIFGIFLLLAIALNLMTRTPGKPRATAAGGSPVQQTTGGGSAPTTQGR
jgi:hypothetical protein